MLAKTCKVNQRRRSTIVQDMLKDFGHTTTKIAGTSASSTYAPGLVKKLTRKRNSIVNHGHA